MTIGLFGGSFNPVHNGHVGIAKRAIEEYHLDRLLIIPAALNPFKADGNSGRARSPSAPLSPSFRLSLCHLAFDPIPRCVVDDRELRRGGISYAIDTVREVAAEHPGAALIFLTGEDCVADLPRWKNYDELTRLCTFRFFPRTPESSTLVRDRLARGLPIDDLVPPAVATALSHLLGTSH